MRDLIRQIAMEHELHIISGKVARDHVHVFVSYRPHQDLSTIVQWLKGISSRVLLQEFAHLRKKFWGRHFWARGYLAVSSGSITDEMVKEYIDSQDGEPLHDDSQFPIDSPGSHRLLGGGCSLLSIGLIYHAWLVKVFLEPGENLSDLFRPAQICHCVGDGVVVSELQ